METSLNIRLVCIFTLSYCSLTSAEPEDAPGHVTGYDVPLVKESHVHDTLEYVDNLLKEKYGLDVDFNDVLVTSNPRSELPQRDTTNAEMATRRNDRLLTGRSASSSSYTSPAVMYNPTTMEEIPEEEDEEDEKDDVDDDPVRLQNLVNKLHKHVKASQTSQIRTR